MKTAIVHDWLNGMRGGEKVLEALLELYPDSTIYTLFYQRGAVSAAIANRRIVTSWLDRVPGIYSFYRKLLPVFPAAIESLKFEGFDLVISSSHAVAKCIRSEGTPHISYCHTPMRYLWDAEDDYSSGTLQRAALSALRFRLRQWDCATAKGVDHFIANSHFVQERIRRYYGREATVIYPPVDTRFFTPSGRTRRGQFYLAAGALVPYKRFDLVVEAFNKIGKPLIVAGAGPELKRLRRLAGPHIRFTGWVSDRELRDLYRKGRALVFAGREDFGMIPVEAQACGCPVIAFAGGGSVETIQDGVSGVFFSEQHPRDIASAVARFERMSWTPESVRSHVEGFSRENFKTRIQDFIEKSVSAPPADLTAQFA